MPVATGNKSNTATVNEGPDKSSTDGACWSQCACLQHWWRHLLYFNQSQRTEADGVDHIY